MKNWKVGTLSDLVIFQRGFDITKAQQSPGIVPIISSSGVSSYHNKAKCKAPGVITGRKGTLGEVFFAKEDYWPHDTTLWVKDFKINDPKFTYYFLKLLKMETYDVGASNPTLNRNHLHKLKVSLPLPKIQRKIAAVLSAYDDLIENNNRRIAILEKMAEELYREWFVRLRFPGHEKTKIIKGVPKGWEVKKIGELTSFEKGKNPKILYDESSSERELYLSVDALENRILRFTLKKNSVMCDIDETIMLMDGARSSIVFNGQKGIVSSTFAVVRTKKEFRAILHEYFKANLGAMVSNNTGSAIPHANKKFIAKMLIKLPKENQLILAFNNHYSNLFKFLLNLKNKKRFLFKSRDKLLSRLMSGKIDLENLDIHFPASMQEDE